MRIPRDQSPSDDPQSRGFSDRAAPLANGGSELQCDGPLIPTSFPIYASTALKSSNTDKELNGDNEVAKDGTSLVDRLESLTFAQQEPVPDSLGHELPHVRASRQSSFGMSTTADLYNATPRGSPSPAHNSQEHRSQAGSRAKGKSNNVEEGLDITSGLGSLNLGPDESDYDVREEPLPREPYFNRGFQRALKLATATASDLHSSITSHGRSHESLPELYKQLETSKRLGTYARKSSLINSLLDVRNLAHKGDWGTAVTSFVTEYRYRTTQHTAPFTIEVEYCTETEIDDQIYESLISYRDLWRPGIEEEIISAQEFSIIEKKSGEAISILQSIFGDTEHLEPRRLQDFSQGALEKTYVELKALAKNLRWPDGAENGKWSSTAGDDRECQGKVGLFKEDGLWPLTNVVRIFLSAQVLQSGIILADMPGYRDINLARVKKAQQYLIRCDEIFIVASIDRIDSNLTVRELLRAQFRSNAERSKSIAIVCTHADDIHLPSAEKESPQTARLDSTKKAQAELVEAYSKPVALYHLAEIKYKYIYVAARNNNVNAKLALTYPQLAGNGRSNVFCIANDDYEGNKLRHGSAAHKYAVANSGVPELRSFCHSVAAKAQFHAAELFLKIELPSLIQSLDIWLQGPQKAASAAIPADCLDNRQISMKALIDENKQNLTASLQAEVLNTLLGEKEHALSDEAISVSQSWARIHGHPASYKAWVRNNGTHYTDTRLFRCWNTELLYEMNKTLPGKWNIFETKIGESMITLKGTMDAEFERLLQQVQDLKAPAAVTHFVYLKKWEMSYTIIDDRSKLLRAVGTCLHNTTGVHLSSYALEAMIPIYRACNEEHGRGMMKRMEGIMDANMNRRPVFTHIREQIKTFVEAQLLLLHAALAAKLETVCKELREQLGTLQGPRSEVSRCNDADRERIRGAVAEARRKMGAIDRDAAPAREEARVKGY